MGTDNRSHMVWALGVPVNEGPRRMSQGVQADKERAIGDLTTERPPAPLQWIQPRAVGRPRQPPQPPRRGAYHGFDLILTRGIGLLPNATDRAGGVLVDHGLPPFGHFPATFAAPEQDDGLACLVMDRPQALPFRGLTRREDHHLWPLRTPHGPQRRPPTEVAFVGGVAHVSCAQGVAGRFHRLCVP